MATASSPTSVQRNNLIPQIDVGSNSYSSTRDGSSTYDYDSDLEARDHRESFETRAMPSPRFPGRLSLTTAHAVHSSRQWVRRKCPTWMKVGGWRQTVKVGATVAVSVLVLNLIILAWGWAQPPNPFTGQRLVASGDCGRMQTISTYWHLAINVFSTLLLATSNAAMQCLSAPTREAMDRAHAKGMWVDIGISGLRNWRYMDRWRKWCWVLLVASTVPLHLLYNSVIVATFTANEYWALAVTPDFIDGASYTLPNQTNFWVTDPEIRPSESLISKIRSPAAIKNGSLVLLENDACIGNYSQTMLNQYSNVLLVTEPFYSSANSSLLRYYYHSPLPQYYADLPAIFATNWICGIPDTLAIYMSSCDINYFRNNAANWNLTAALMDLDDSWLKSNPSLNGQPDPKAEVEKESFYKDEYFWGNESVQFEAWAPPIRVDYCLAQKVEPECTVELIPVIMLVVCLANVVKVVCFVSTLKTTMFKPLVTLGDCLASCLERPDPYTRHLGALSAEEIRKALKRGRSRDWIRKIRYRRERLLAKSVSYNNQNKNNAQVALSYEYLLEHDGERPDPLPGLPLELGRWKATRRRWFTGASRLRWILTYCLMLSSWIVALSVFLISVRTTPADGDFAAQWATGFGNISPNYIITDLRYNSLFSNSIIANIPQLGLSLIYMSLNGLLTCILQSREFTLFGQRRQGLRVSEPAGRYQQSSYWLSLPYRFSVPLLVLSWALHWALSQTLFPAEVIVQSPLGEQDSDNSISSLGYSMLALMILLVLEGIAIITPLLLGWKHYHGGSPLVESYSLAISAACHPVSGRQDQSTRLLIYGGVEEQDDQIGRYCPSVACSAATFPQATRSNQKSSIEGQDTITSPLMGNFIASPDSLQVSHMSSRSLRTASLTSPQASILSISRGLDLIPPCGPSRTTTVALSSRHRNLIATFSEDAVEPLVAPHTYTPKRALTPTEINPSQMSTLPHKRFSRWLRRLLPIGHFLKSASLLLASIWATNPFLVEFYGYIIVYTLVFFGGAHLIICFKSYLLRLRRRTASIRRWWWWWHVAPEISFGGPIVKGFSVVNNFDRIAWLAYLIWLIKMYIGSRNVRVINISSVVTPVASLVVLYFMCGAAEFWLWSLANPGLAHAAISDIGTGRWTFPKLSERLRRVWPHAPIKSSEADDTARNGHIANI